jgi:hypothetical protein
MPELICPVTQGLRNELLAADAMITTHREKGANDRAHYGEAVQQLEALALSLLAAPTVGSLLQPRQDLARIDLAPDGALAKHLAEVVEYLRTTATDLLREIAGPLSLYASDHVRTAMGHLAALYNLAVTSIRRVAEEDLMAIRKNGLLDLLVVADAIAQVRNGAVAELAAEAADSGDLGGAPSA